ncbi:MAG: DNA primase family protein [Candidatus Freyarchaeota archaeon]
MSNKENEDLKLSTIAEKLARINRRFFDDDFRPLPEQFVEVVMENHLFKTLRDTHEILYYENGVYRRGGEEVIASEVEAIYHRSAHKPARTHFVTEIVEAIRRRTYTFRAEFNPSGYVNLKNGILNLDTFELSPHSPDAYFTYQLPVAYDPSAECPAIERFLREVCPDGVETIYEFLGWILEDGYEYQRALLLYGSGNNGKSTLLSLIRAFLGPENVSSRPLQDLVTNRFATADLYGKLANICADLPNIALANTGIFKILTGGDPITAERKFKDGFQFVNRAKLIFSTNELFGVEDSSYAFWRRWILLEFPNDFTGRERKQSELLASLTTEKELSGLLNRALEGLTRLKVRGGFAQQEKSEELKLQWAKQSQPVRAFTLECLEVDLEGEVEKDVVYDAFCEYCRDNDLLPIPKDQFSRKLLQTLPGIRASRVRRGDRRVHVFRGVSLREQKKLAFYT